MSSREEEEERVEMSASERHERKGQERGCDHVCPQGTCQKAIALTAVFVRFCASAPSSHPVDTCQADAAASAADELLGPRPGAIIGPLPAGLDPSLMWQVTRYNL